MKAILDDRGIVPLDSITGKMVDRILLVYPHLKKELQKPYPYWTGAISTILSGFGIDVISNNVLSPLRYWNGEQYNLPKFEQSNVEYLYDFASRDVTELKNRDGVILAYDAGLGKTRMSLVLAQKWGGSTLIVAKKRLHQQWLDEIEDVGFDNRFSIKSYGELSKSEGQIRGFDNAIFDESHTIKNPETDVFGAAINLQTQKRLALTATSTDGYVRDIDGILKWVSFGNSPLSNNFREIYGIQDGAREIPGIVAAKQFRNTISPFIKTRLHDEPDVVMEVSSPPSEKSIIRMDMEGSIQELYLKNMRSVWGWWLEYPTEAKARLGLERVFVACSLPQYFEPTMSPTLLQKTVASHVDKYTIIFVRRAITGKFYSDFLGLDFIDSSTSQAKMDYVKRNFRLHGKPFIVTYGTGAEGLNLPEGNKIVFAEPEWSGWKITQSMGRITRGTRDSNPEYVFPIYKYSILEYMMEVAFAKQLSGKSISLGVNYKPHIPNFSSRLETIVKMFKGDTNV